MPDPLSLQYDVNLPLSAVSEQYNVNLPLSVVSEHMLNISVEWPQTVEYLYYVLYSRIPHFVPEIRQIKYLIFKIAAFLQISIQHDLTIC